MPITIVPPSALAKAEINGAKSEGFILADFDQNIYFQVHEPYNPVLV